MGSNSPSYGPWSMLLEELLEIILYRLELADHIRFGAVCKGRKSIAVKNTAANKPFSLVRTANPRHLIYRFLHSFNSWQWHHARFFEGVKDWRVLRLSYQIIQPELGSSKTRRQLILLNPGSRMAPILLPPLPSWSYSVQKVVLSSPPDESSLDMGTIVFKDKFDLGFCRLGDTDWTRIYIWSPSDILFYKEQLCVIDWKCVLRVFDSGLNSEPTCCLTFPPCRECHLVISSDKLLLIHITYPDRIYLNLPDKSSPCFCKAFEIDLKGIPGYIEMESLGDDKILFLSSHCSLCLPVKENPEFTQTHIYKSRSIDDNLVYYGSLGKKMLHGTYNDRNLVFFPLFGGDGFKYEDGPTFLR